MAAPECKSAVQTDGPGCRASPTRTPANGGCGLARGTDSGKCGAAAVGGELGGGPEGGLGGGLGCRLGSAGFGWSLGSAG
jgi:hypothetical protein